ncbi:UNKNOWN [Stylonychia lemnae]|uniref:Uncharacterized protein n=1 Tax=Stylonychia lemnae TaxID=5949 RepID=A0A078B2V3_STYLE|nr:UNKNOWN [Stylonychia lemnae]|eukprot:CDW87838.1 UNKNOWN [Stylonychia lemnae]
MQEIREMLYQNVQDLNTVKNSLIDCYRLPKSKRQQQIRVVDQFLIDLNDEIVDINAEISKGHLNDGIVEDFRMRVNELISSIQENINTDEIDKFLEEQNSQDLSVQYRVITQTYQVKSPNSLRSFKIMTNVKRTANHGSVNKSILSLSKERLNRELDEKYQQFAYNSKIENTKISNPSIVLQIVDTKNKPSLTMRRSSSYIDNNSIRDKENISVQSNYHITDHRSILNNPLLQSKRNDKEIIPKSKVQFSTIYSNDGKSSIKSSFKLSDIRDSFQQDSIQPKKGFQIKYLESIQSQQTNQKDMYSDWVSKRLNSTNQSKLSSIRMSYSRK